MPEDFVLLSEVVPDIILEIRYYSTYNFVGARVDGYEAPVAIMTKKAASALKEVSDELIARGYCLKVFDAYRPQKAVSHFVRWAEDLDDVKMKPSFYPDVDKSRLFELGYIMNSRGTAEARRLTLLLWRLQLARSLIWAALSTGSENCHTLITRILQMHKKPTGLSCAMRCCVTASTPLNRNGGTLPLPKSPYPDTYFNFPIKLY